MSLGTSGYKKLGRLMLKMVVTGYTQEHSCWGSQQCQGLEKKHMLTVQKEKWTKVLLRTFRTEFQKQVPDPWWILLSEGSKQVFEGQGAGKCNTARAFDSSLPFCLPREKSTPFTFPSCRNCLDSDFSGCFLLHHYFLQDKSPNY